MFFLVERYFALVWLLNDENMQHSMLDLICGRAATESPAAAANEAEPPRRTDATEGRGEGGRRDGAAADRKAPSKETPRGERARRRRSLSPRRVSFSRVATSSASAATPPASRHRTASSHQDEHRIQAGGEARRRISRAAVGISSPEAAVTVGSRDALLRAGSVALGTATKETHEEQEEHLLQRQRQQSGSGGEPREAAQRVFETVGVHSGVRLSVDSREAYSPRLPAAVVSVDSALKSDGNSAAAQRVLDGAAAKAATTAARTDTTEPDSAFAAAGALTAVQRGAHKLRTDAEDIRLRAYAGSNAEAGAASVDDANRRSPAEDSRRRHSITQSQLAVPAQPEATAITRRHSTNSLLAAPAHGTSASASDSSACRRFSESIAETQQGRPQLETLQQQEKRWRQQQGRGRQTIGQPQHALCSSSEMSRPIESLGGDGSSRDRPVAAGDAQGGSSLRAATGRESQEGEEQQQRRRNLENQTQLRRKQQQSRRRQRHSCAVRDKLQQLEKKGQREEQRDAGGPGRQECRQQIRYVPEKPPGLLQEEQKPQRRLHSRQYRKTTRSGRSKGPPGSSLPALGQSRGVVTAERAEA